MRTRTYSMTIVFLVAVVGLTSLSEALDRLLPIHFPISDIVQLVGVGLCFGIAISLLYGRLRAPKE